MKCPYCLSEVPVGASVCASCRRDLFLFQPILERVDALEAEVADLRKAWADMDAQRGSAAENSPIAETAAQQPPAAGGHAVLPASAGQDAASAAEGRPAWTVWLGALTLLLISHALIVVLLDLNTAWLRLVSLVIPVPFGYVAALRTRAPFTAQLLMAVAVAGAAIFGMSALLAALDGTPVLPTNAQDWREFLQYGFSIFFGFMTGLIVGRYWRAYAGSASLIATLLARAGGLDPKSADALNERVQSLHRLFTTVAATGTTVAALVAGLKGVWGP